jgi:ankyrin repeat protein
VALQVNDICSQKRDADIRQTIAALPKGLPETYQRILSRISQGNLTEIVKKAFYLIAAVKRPLVLDELREAMAVEPGDEFLERQRLVNEIGGLPSWCGNMITVDEEDLLVQFAHYTVKEFLLSKAWDMPTAVFHFGLADINHAAGEICVTYLNLIDFKRQLIKTPKPNQPVRPSDLFKEISSGGQSRLLTYGVKLVEKVHRRPKVEFDLMTQLKSVRDILPDSIGPDRQYHFLQYASEHWLSHTVDFTRSNTKLWEEWKELVLTEHPLAPKPWSRAEEKSVDGSVTNYILNKCHYALLRCFLDLTPSVASSSVDLIYLLVMTSEKGDKQAVQLILEFRQNIMRDRTVPLEATNETIIRQPYHDFVNFPSTNNWGHKALEVAVAGGHLEIVEMLILAGAEVHTAASEYDGQTALQTAVEGGHSEILERLLAAGAEVNTAASKYGGRTALQAAAESGNLEIVERLLAARAEVNTAASERGGRTALQAAAERGNIEVVDRLLSAGAEVNAAASRSLGKTALQAAAERGNIEVVDRLLSAGAEVNAAASRSFGKTALQAAAESGDIEIVDRLLAAGAEVNAAASRSLGQTALQAAAKHGSLEIVDRLLAAGAKLNESGTSGLTPISVAHLEGHHQVEERLKAAGAK